MFVLEIGAGIRVAVIVLISSFLIACGGSSSDAVVTEQGSGGTSGGDTGSGGPNSTGNGTSGDGDDDDATDDTEGTDDNATAASPNFLLIITDDQGLDASSQYSFSDDLPSTPNIDQLASTGIVFDNMWATPSCTTTRGSLLTGLHGVNSGVDTTPSLLDTGILTVQKHLGANGYQSSVFGKWHVSGGNGSGNLLHPNQTGVDHYAGNLAGTLDDYSSWDLTVNGVQQTSGIYHTTALTDMAIEWIDQQQGPWFTWVAYVAPHSPFHLPPSELHNRSLSGTDEDIDSNPRPYYLAAIEAMDTEIGRLIDSIDPDQRENTVIMVLGDNGTPSAIIDTNAFPRSHGKGSLYEGGTRVPFVVSAPSIGSGNVREAALVNTVDVMPTLSELAGIAIPAGIDGVSFGSVLSDSNAAANAGQARQFNYSEFIGDRVTGWTVRDAEFKLIEMADGTREFYDLRSNIREESNIIDQPQYAERIAGFDAFAAQVRSGQSGSTQVDGEVSDITGVILQNTSANCAEYAASYQSRALDVNNNTAFNGSLQIEVADGNCTFTSNAIPNHDFNDIRNFPNVVAEQNVQYTITANPVAGTASTPLLITMDDAILLNGVKIDALAAACFGVGDERTGCSDPEQPWRFDTMFAANGFRHDSHNAHTQPDGAYHYHGSPNALFQSDQAIESPVVGFAADGFPIYGSYFNDGETIRKARSGFRLKTDPRPDGAGNPGGVPDGTFRDDYEYVEGLGDLDECNGMTVNGTYGYYLIDEFPYVLSCFRGTPDASFFK